MIDICQKCRAICFSIMKSLLLGLFCWAHAINRKIKKMLTTCIGGYVLIVYQFTIVIKAFTNLQFMYIRNSIVVIINIYNSSKPIKFGAFIYSSNPKPLSFYLYHLFTYYDIITNLQYKHLLG